MLWYKTIIAINIQHGIIHYSDAQKTVEYVYLVLFVHVYFAANMHKKFMKWIREDHVYLHFA